MGEGGKVTIDSCVKSLEFGRLYDLTAHRGFRLGGRMSAGCQRVACFGDSIRRGRGQRKAAEEVGEEVEVLATQLSARGINFRQCRIRVPGDGLGK